MTHSSTIECKFLENEFIGFRKGFQILRKMPLKLTEVPFRHYQDPNHIFNVSRCTKYERKRRRKKNSIQELKFQMSPKNVLSLVLSIHFYLFKCPFIDVDMGNCWIKKKTETKWTHEAVEKKSLNSKQNLMLCSSLVPIVFSCEMLLWESLSK